MNWIKRNKEIQLLRGGNFSAQVHLYQNQWWGTLFISGKTHRIAPNNCLSEAKQCIEKLISKHTAPNP
jgi:hypothetical protein